MLNAICITTNQLEHIQTNLCIHLSYLEDQRNLKIYNKNILKRRKKRRLEYMISYGSVLVKGHAVAYIILTKIGK